MKLFSFFAAACCLFIFLCAVCACNNEINIESNWTLTSLITPDTEFSAEKGSLTVPLTLFAAAQNTGVPDTDMPNDANTLPAVPPAQTAPQISSQSTAPVQNTKSKQVRTYHIAGFSGINRYSGTLTLSGSAIKVQLNEYDQAEGPADKMNLERLFCSILQKGGTVSVSTNAAGSELVIFNLREKTELTFKKSVLENTNWKLNRYNKEHAMLQAPESVRYASLSFTDSNRLYGNTGVNNFSAACFIKSGSALSIAELAVTRIASPNGEAAEFERRYMELLKQCVLFTVEGGTLNLKNRTGEVLLTYTQF